MGAFLIPIIAIISSVALPIIVGAILGFKKINSDHKERMGLIQQGIIPPDEPKRKSKQTTPNRYVSLRNGILLVSLGIGFITGFVGIKYLVIGDDYPFFFIVASVVLFLGLGYIVFFLITKKSKGYNNYDLDRGLDSELDADAE